jgi:hypothetical protein
MISARNRWNSRRLLKRKRVKIAHLLFLAFAGAGVSETFGERVVIDLQLRDLNQREGVEREKNVIIIPVVTHARRFLPPARQ